MVNRNIEYIKVILSGTIERPITVRGLRITKGVRAAIEKAGGTIENNKFMANKPGLKQGMQGGLTELKNRLLFVRSAYRFRAGSFVPIPGIELLY